jgi:hypothetical protein
MTHHEPRITAGLHIDPDDTINPRAKFYPAGSVKYISTGYGCVELGPLNVFVHSATAAHQIAAAFAEVAAQFPAPVPADGPATVRNSYPDLLREEAVSLAMAHLRLTNPTPCLDNAVDEGRWGNSWGYVTYDPATERYALYAYEPVAS